MKNTLKGLTALILVLSMSLGLLCPSAFAREEDQVKDGAVSGQNIGSKEKEEPLEVDYPVTEGGPSGDDYEETEEKPDDEEIPGEESIPLNEDETEEAVPTDTAPVSEEYSSVEEAPSAEALLNTSSEKQVYDSGTCGDELTWKLEWVPGGSKRLILTISGKGDMDFYSDYSQNTRPPWYDNRHLIETVVINSGVTSIGDNAFADCSSLQSVTLPDQLEYIEYCAFSGCTSLCSITIPDSVHGIGARAFYNCSSLKNVTIPDSVAEVDATSFSGTPWQEAMNKDGFVINRGTLVQYQGDAENVTIPASVTKIGSSAFAYCTSIKSVIIPAHVTSIDDEAFYECTNLASVTIPEGVESIGSHAFCKCRSLTQITIPDSTTSIGMCAFSSCTGLKNVKLPKKMKHIENYAFSDCRSLSEISIPEGISFIDVKTFLNCSSLRRIAIPASVTQIASSAFQGCSSLASVSFEEGLETIESSAFSGCTSLTTVVFPASLKTLGEYAFALCASLQSAALPGTVEIGECAFTGCAPDFKLIDRENGQVIGSVEQESLPTHNAGLQDQIDNWATPIQSSLSLSTDDSFLRMEYDRNLGGIIAETISPSGKMLSSHSLPMELPLYGGIFAGKTANYLFFGQTNWEEDDSTEVIRVVKYSREWKRLGDASLYGANTVVPFEAGSLRVAEAGDVLYVRTAHKMYKSDDGKNHQANLAFVLKQSSMEITDSHFQVSHSGYGYVSHSFNQFFSTDGEDLIAVDHGDAYPRAVVLSRFKNKPGEEKLTEHDRAIILSIRGVIGDNATGVSVGGVEISRSHYLVAGNSVAQDSSYDPSSVRNIFVGAVPKGNVSDGAVKLKWLTHYTGQKKPSTPQLVKLSDSRFLLLWTYDGQLNYTFLNADGTQDGTVFRGNTPLSDCQPILKDGKVYWYVTDDSSPVYYYIDLSQPDTVHVLNPSHTLTFDPNGGTIDATVKEVQHGEKYGSLPQPKHPKGYGFLGWFTRQHGGERVTAEDAVPVRDQEKLYAHWSDEWNYNRTTGVLTIFKKGKMDDFSEDNPSPWNEYKNSIKKVEIQAGLISIGNYAFYDCVNLSSISIPEGVTSIGESAFWGSGITSLSIPGSVVDMAEDALCYCDKLTYLETPCTLTNLDTHPIGDCSDTLEKAVIFPASSGDSNAVQIGEDAFSYFPKLKEVVISDGITGIKDSAFSSCDELNKVSIPDTVTQIGQYAFASCSKLNRIRISKNVIQIGNYAFYDCVNLSSISIPEGVTSFGEYAFCGSGITSLSIPGSVVDMAEDALCYCDKLTYLETPCTLTNLDTHPIGYCSDTLEKVVIFPASSGDSKAVQIGAEAFSNFSELKEVVISDGITGIKDSAFHSCDVLNKVSIPDTVTQIERYVFAGCPKLSRIRIPKNVIQIGDNAFDFFTIIEGYSDSAIEQYAERWGYDFEPLDGSSIKKAAVTISSQTYTGKPLKPAPKVVAFGKTLRPGTDYTVSYENNKKVGTAVVIVTGMGRYVGTVKGTFKINPKATTLTAVKPAGKGKMTVKWKKNTSGKGYQLQFTTDKSFKKKTKTVNINRNSIVNTTVKKLKTGTYYVRIRTVSGKNHSSWSKGVKVKISK